MRLSSWRLSVGFRQMRLPRLARHKPPEHGSGQQKRARIDDLARIGARRPWKGRSRLPAEAARPLWSRKPPVPSEAATAVSWPPERRCVGLGSARPFALYGPQNGFRRRFPAFGRTRRATIAPGWTNAGQVIPRPAPSGPKSEGPVELPCLGWSWPGRIARSEP